MEKITYIEKVFGKEILENFFLKNQIKKDLTVFEELKKNETNKTDLQDQCHRDA